jgi:hypothetical protein
LALFAAGDCQIPIAASDPNSSGCNPLRLVNALPAAVDECPRLSVDGIIDNEGTIGGGEVFDVSAIWPGNASPNSAGEVEFQEPATKGFPHGSPADDDASGYLGEARWEGACSVEGCVDGG